MKNKIIQNMIRHMESNMAGNRTIRNRRARVMAITLCAALALGQAGAVKYAQAAEGRAVVQETDSGEMMQKTDSDTAGWKAEGPAALQDWTVEGSGYAGGRKMPVNLLLAVNTGSDSAVGSERNSAAGDTQNSKEETVYVLADAGGSVQKIIVSDWIKNALGKSMINDISELKELETVKDELTYTTGKSDEKIWDAQGKDIYYQGNIEKELPVTMTVSYLLDGKEISPRELAGKSGKVTIRFDYANRQYEEVEINGEKTEIAVPFAMITGMILDDDIFTNVEVTNGRLVNDGDRTVVVGLAFPGLQESLDVDPEKMDIPDYVEITADVKEFELGMTATVASNDVFSDIQLEKEGALEELDGSMTDLTDAMEQLMDGSSQLYDGLCTLFDKSGELIKGIDQLASGSAELRNGAGSLDQGASQLQDGAAKLQNGLNTLTSKNQELNGGARQVFETLLSTARTQLTAAGLDVPEMAIGNYGEVLNQVIASLDEAAVYQQALDQVTNAVEENRSYIQSQVTDVVREEVAAKVDAAVREQVTARVTEAAQEQVRAAVTEAVRQQVTEEVTRAVQAQVTEEVTAAVKAAVTQKVEEAGKAEITGQVTEAVKAEVIRQVTEAVKEQVKEAVNAEVEAQVRAQVIQTVTGMDSDAYEKAVAEGTVEEQVQSAVREAIGEQMRSDAVQSQIEANVESQMSGDGVKAQIEANTQAQMSGDEVKAQIDAKVNEIINAKVEEQMAAEAVKAEIQNNITAQMETIVPAKVEEQMTSEAVQSAIQANVEAQMETIIPAKVEEQMATEEIQATIQANIEAQMQSDALQETVAANTELQVQKAITENMASEEVQSKLAAASEGAKTVIALKASLDNYNVFYLGLQAYTAGVAEAASGAGTLSAGINELKGGTSKLYAGSVQLYDGIQTMKKSAPALTDGIKKLRDGALELSDGLGRFNEEGIGKLVDAVDGDLDSLMHRVKAISDVSKKYKTFTGITDEMDGSVKFIYRTDAIETDNGK